MSLYQQLLLYLMIGVFFAIYAWRGRGKNPYYKGALTLILVALFWAAFLGKLLSDRVCSSIRRRRDGK